MPAPVVEGLLETALYVSDIERSVVFYRALFGFELIHSEGDRLRALSIADKQVLLLFRVGASRQPTDTPNGRIPPHDGHGTLHLAFAVSSADIPLWRDRLTANGIAIESEVHCGGHSIYFRDPDSHLVELISAGCWSIF